MRPRAIQQVPRLNPNLDSFGRFKQFARMILAVPKEKADKQGKKEESKKSRRGPRSKPQNGNNNGRGSKTEGGSHMSEKLLKNLCELSRSIEENTPRVKDSMTKSGRRDPDSAVVSSAAKYHEALEKLAKE